MTSERRRWPRIDVELYAVMRFSRTEDVLDAKSLNISKRGVYLATEQLKPLGTPVHLSIEIDEDGQRLEIHGIVIHENREATASRPKGLGIFLTAVPDHWNDFCLKLEEKKGSPLEA